MNDENAPLYSTLASEEDYREILVMFVDEMPERIRRFENAFAAQHWDDLKAAAHQLKGSAGGYGFASVSAAASDLNELLKVNASTSNIAIALNALLALCRRITAEPEAPPMGIGG